jgi:hypothetical protein
MADINDRLERLSRREELGRRARQRAVPETVAGVGDDFLEIVEAVAHVVRRHPGMSILLAPGDGRQGSAVIRVTERQGEAEVATVTAAGAAPPTPDPGPDPDRDPDRRPGDVGEPGVPYDRDVPGESGVAGDPAHRPPGPWRPPARDAVPRRDP